MQRSLIAAAITLVSSPVLAQETFENLVENARENALGPGADLILTIAFVIGAVFFLMVGIAFFRNRGNQHGEQLQAGRIVALLIGGTILMGFPTWLGVGPASLFSDGDTAAIDGTLRSIGD